MAKYTTELNFLITNNIPYWTFEEDVIDYLDEYFTLDKWEEIKKLFDLKYYYCEIGQETPEMFSHYLKLSFIERINTFKKLLKINEDELNGNMLDDSHAESSATMINEVLPDTELDTFTHANEKMKQVNAGTGRSAQKIDLFENYYRKLRDLEDEFVEGFRDCFMMIY